MENDDEALRMIHRRKPEWQRLISGLYVPPFLHFGDPYPCDDCCNKCPCPECDGDNPPCCFKIVLSGMTDDGCSQCHCFNGAYYVENTSDCVWQGSMGLGIPCTDSAGDIPRITVFDDGGNFKLKFEIGGLTWIKNYGATKPTCEDLVDESIPFSTSGEGCDASSSTCLVTAVISGGACPTNYEPCCPCNPSHPSDSMQVVISGMAEGSCGNCVSLDGVYVLSAEVGARDVTCVWTTVLDEVCEIIEMRLAIVGPEGFPNLGRVQVVFNATGAATRHSWENSGLTHPFSCAFSSLNVAFDFSSGSAQCDSSSATCIVTAL